MKPPMPPRQADVLEKVLAEAAPDGGRPAGLVVFDLDDTLLSTAQRHLRILKEFAAEAPRRGALAKARPGDLRYSIVDTARALGVEEPALLAELRAYWFERFFRNEYIEADEPFPGAPEFCREVLSRGGTVVYVTGRDETMRTGTLKALSRHGFPVPGSDRVSLMLKPAFETPDAEFKARALLGLAELGRVAGGFENEPTHVNLFFDAFPASRMVFVDSKHSGKPVSPHPHIPWIKDFLRG